MEKNKKPEKVVITINVPLYGEKVWRAAIGGYDRPFKGWQPTDFVVQPIFVEGAGYGYRHPIEETPKFFFASVCANSLEEIKQYYSNKNKYCPRWNSKLK